MKIKAKICGLKTKEAIYTAESSGAEFLGFIFAKDSPRYITPSEAGRIASAATVKKVAVVVNASDAELEEIVAELKPDYIQLHGNENDERAREIKYKFNTTLIRATPPNAYPELDEALYDYLLIDTPGGGGRGIPFDWTRLTPPKQKWFISGGLNVDNIAEAVKTTGAKLVDISSGVESSRGVKDLDKIKAFLKAVNEFK